MTILFTVFLLFEIENIMNTLNKTKEELVKELQEVRKERDALKASRGKDIIGSNLTEEALRESEENFRLIFENNSAAMALIEPDTTISMVNEEYCRISGYTKQEVIGMSWTQQIPPQDLERLKEYNHRRLINPKDVPEKYEFTFYHKNGKIMHSMMSITLLSNQKRIASFYDITERKKAEAALRESNAMYQAIFESTGTATLIVEEDTTILMANNECFSITGYIPAELIGQKWIQYVAPESLQEMLKNHQLRRQNPDLAPKKYEVKLVNKKGEIRDAILDINVISDTRQSVVSILDISESKKAEEELRLSEEKYRTLTENIGEGVGFINDEEIFVYANPSAEKIFGVGEGGLTGLCINDFLVDENIELVQHETQKRRQGKSSVFEHEIVLKDGSKKIFLRLQLRVSMKKNSLGHLLFSVISLNEKEFKKNYGRANNGCLPFTIQLVQSYTNWQSSQ